MARGSRRGRLWLPYSSGANPLTLTPGAFTRLFVESIMEAEVERQMEGFTVERILLRMSLVAAAGTVICTVGIHLQQEDVTLGVISAEDDPTSDWLYREEFAVRTGTTHELIERDIRSKRISRGRDSELYWEMTNRDSVDGVDFHVSGQVLVLLP